MKNGPKPFPKRRTSALWIRNPPQKLDRSMKGSTVEEKCCQTIADLFEGYDAGGGNALDRETLIESVREALEDAGYLDAEE